MIQSVAGLFFFLQREALEVSAANFWSKKTVFLMIIKNEGPRAHLR